MLRHSLNTNLLLHTDHLFRGYPVQVEKGPLVANYLAVLADVLENVLSQYPRVFAFRCDLRLPAGTEKSDQADSNEMLNRFFASLKAKITHSRELARKKNGYAHTSSVRYVWAREMGAINGHVHYHLVILLNADAFNTLGQFELGRSNLFNRIIEAWAGAWAIETSLSQGLVEFPADSRYLLRRGEDAITANFFYRASYLCKVATKPFGQGVHCFGASRLL